MTTRDGLITSEFDDASTFDTAAPYDEVGAYGASDLDSAEAGADDEWDDTDDDDDEEEEHDPLDVDLELVVLDMAGTTVVDDGLVVRAFEIAAEAAGIGETPEELVSALDYVRETMGQSKIAVFRALTDDEDQAQHANAEFESAYAALAASEGLRAVPGAEDLIRRLRSAGVKVALTTGFSRPTQDAVLAALGWQDLADVTLSPAEAGRGRPYPDLPLTALLRTGATSVEGMVVVGDTASDIVSGIAAGAGLVVGVLTGAHDEDTLHDAGADAVIPSVADLLDLLGFDTDPLADLDTDAALR
ncbi:phosphonatase-like hydrolase [Leifsonia poae]|uniref:phosphonatase-like hydrolase n=1 Tax=Leifsonia poae TaxID=110933 RepID=UPI001CC090E9|nr:phosphonatase-like hydrolase [Leifsonia poae]